MLEHSFPFRVDAYRIRQGSGGIGKHAGGEGLIRRYVFDAPAQVTLLTERRRHAPYGLAGGHPGSPGVNRMIHTDAAITTLPSKCTLDVQPGDTIETATPGGGGWGNPITNSDNT